MLHLHRKNYDPPVEFFIEKLDQNIHFQFCKLNAAFWDAALTFKKNPDIEPVEIASWLPQGWLHFHGVEFMREMLDILRDLHNTEILLGVSETAAPGIQVKNQNEDEDIRAFIKSFFPSHYRLFYGPLMKKYALNHSLDRLVRNIALNKDVLVVGISHTKQIKNHFDFKNFLHLELDLHKTTERRQEILQIILEKIAQLNQPVVLFQAGESLSLWFSYQIQKITRSVTTIDLGRSLDLWCIPEVDSNYFPDIKTPLWKRLLDVAQQKK